jgi:cellulase/cellobiase CelA1
MIPSRRRILSRPLRLHVDNPFVGADGYLNPDYTVKVLAAAQSMGGTLGAGMTKVADYSTAVWMDRIAAIEGSADGPRLRAGAAPPPAQPTR